MKTEFEVICKNCGKKFTVVEEETKFPIKGDKYFCCRSCANTRHHSDETKKKISKSLLIYNGNSDELPRRKPSNKIGIGESKSKYFCGSEELDILNPEISKHQSKNYFIKFIPFGLDFSKIYTIDFVNEYTKVRNLLYSEYVINKLSPSDIYKKYGCSNYINNSETLLHVFKDMGFPIRNVSEAVTLSWLDGKLGNNKGDDIHYIQGWHTTWNGKNVYLRSSYEFDYANELDSKKINYDVEKLRIKYFDSSECRYRCAVPDFYLPDTNTIVEIKSEWTLNVQEMKDKVKSYKDLGYNVVIICEHKEISLEV